MIFYLKVYRSNCSPGVRIIGPPQFCTLMLRSLQTPLRLGVRAASARTASAALFRNLHFNSKSYRPTAGFKVYSEELENDIRDQILSIPAKEKVFQNPDGSPRVPSDEELQKLAMLANLANKTRATFWDKFKLNEDQKAQLTQNDFFLREFADEGKLILDKIPKEDPITGEVTWEVVREGQKEGWETLTYYGYIPALVITLVFLMFLDNESPDDWAFEELKLRAQERFNEDLTSTNRDLTPEEIKKRDALIVERIISGDYDRLAGLKKAGSDMPASLL